MRNSLGKTVAIIFVCVFMFLFFVAVLVGTGFYHGRKSAFNDFILEKCELKSNRDIVCISYIAD